MSIFTNDENDGVSQPAAPQAQIDDPAELQAANADELTRSEAAHEAAGELHQADADQPPLVPPILGRWLGHDYTRQLEGKVEQQRLRLSEAQRSRAELRTLVRQAAGSHAQLSPKLCQQSRVLEARVDELLEASREADTLADAVADYGDANERERQAAETAEATANQARAELGKALAEQEALMQLSGHPKGWLEDPTPWAWDGTVSNADMWARSRAAYLLLEEGKQPLKQQTEEVQPPETGVQLGEVNAPGYEFG